MKTNIIKSADKINKALSTVRYISFSDWNKILTESSTDLPNSFIDYLKLLFAPSKLLAYFNVRKVLRNGEYIRSNHNNYFTELELNRCSEFFDGIEQFGLDEQQRKAVIANEDNALIIAGAGSGKTTTIVGKVKYLIEYLDAEPSSILPISFTRKSAESLKERINIPGITPQTFHKFGLTALQTVEHQQPTIFDEANSKKLFQSILEELSQDVEYLANLTDFFTNYIKITKSQFDFETLGDYIQYLKDQNFTSYKKVKVPHNGRETYRNETVKSIEECMIANHLTFSRVNYEYEKQYEFPYEQFGRKKNYKPDFTLDSNVYLEHFGIDKNGNVPPFFAGPGETNTEASAKYNRSIVWKRKTHNENKTTLIESYSHQFMDGTLISCLKDSLESSGIPIDPMTNEEVWSVIKDSGSDEVDGFIELARTFLTLLKSNDVNIESLQEKIEESSENAFIKKRSFIFLKLFIPIYEAYENYLKDNCMIDFNDMISRASECIENGDYHCPLKYVIIDEFQDLSVGRYKILQAIKKQNPDVRFYCVGDDWQSIYRFAGSDIALFRDYENYFGYTFKAYIETTYRFNNPLISTSTDFILKNPNQTKKELKAPKGFAPTGYTIIESEGYENDDTDALIDAINNLLNEGLKPEETIYLIGRYNFDIGRIMNKNRAFIINTSTGLIKYKIPIGDFTGKTLNIQFVTAHKSKGLEADYVIVINCNSGKYGFPSGKADDPILNLLLSSADQFENGEERRLFYVAMTRTKKHVVFIADRYKKSKFIKELQDEGEGREKACPKCKKGELILRSGKTAGRSFKFYGCSNFSYGCDYSKAFKAGDEEINITKPMQSREEVNKPIKLQNQIVNNQDIPVSKTEVIKSTAASKLTISELNRLNYFLIAPKKYATTEKGREKVLFLKNISNKFTDKQKQQFDAAIQLWEK